ncbi:hypothetical protein H6P81_020735 [Aristolochia fimbriata]|uniref:Uncharacterized protein n=1 Tax=Aristolochia fimbriata TaxID=158543 RepID=A0AAV7DV80_ARIFI|nr:hypothetical protein H6P81_020735 [Aristolochia fimbriata]
MGNIQGRSVVNPLDRILISVVQFIDRILLWHRLPVILGLAYLGVRRHIHNKYNLIAVGDSGAGVTFDPSRYPFRTADGRYNDPSNALAGSQGTFFGRNMLPAATSPDHQNYKIMDPNPVVVADKLLARRKMLDTGKQFNMIAASWIQFMIHDWIDHLEDTEQAELRTPASVQAGCPLKSFRFFKTKQVPTHSTEINTGHINSRTSWWDGSVIYGNNAKGQDRVRTYKDGKLRISDNGLLPHDEDGILISGDVRNSWVGVSVLQALFVKEHNLVCDMLKNKYPELGDEELYRYARLVTSAVIAKVHTIDWTVELLKNNTLLAGMRANWYGLLGKTIKDRFGHLGSFYLSGYIGASKAENHGVPYSLTEEFVGVYRMHSLLPEELQLRDISSSSGRDESPSVLKEVPMEDLVGLEGESRISEIGFEPLMVSMGHQACGALELWNYPLWMRNLIPQDVNGKSRADLINLAALEIYRDRERGVARYNQFRRNLLLKPISTWEDLTDDEEAITVLRQVYGDDVESLDLLVGLMGEKKMVKGFAISETAFFIFFIMAPRRLEGDRFLTGNFNEETYTREGLNWVNSTESLKDVMNRHYPQLVIQFIDGILLWHRLPVFLGLAYLGVRRHLHNKYNLFAVGDSGAGVTFDPSRYPFRTADGRYNDPSNALAGSKGTFFGRNMLPPSPRDHQQNKIMNPDPVLVAEKLLTRKKMIDTGKQFNMIAASWIQFMIHDWIDHLEDTEQAELRTPASVQAGCHLKSFRFFKTKQVPTHSAEINSAHINSRTSWWDGSVIYGNNTQGQDRVRTYKDGKLRISDNGLLPHDEDGALISGDVRNSWVGVSVLQALFVKEHNLVCDMLKKKYPELEDDELYRYARLVTSAVIAKIHAIDWTVELLKNNTLLAGMRATWYGLLGKTIKDRFGHLGSFYLSGHIGASKAENHGVPYSLTEEFVSVYRMHSLLPEELQLRDISSSSGRDESPSVLKEVPMEDLVGLEGESRISEIGFEPLMVSMGHQACGALELWNYPRWMRNLIPQDVNGKSRADLINLAALEIYRDRERGVARYNQFRRNLLLKPISTWEDLTDDEEAITVLRQVYGDDVESLDLLVGLMGEKKMVKGFAISETAFFIFFIMAPRRLEADRFLTGYFNEETYTREGLNWVNSTESLKEVMNRHYPQLVNKWMNSRSAFSVWDSAPAKEIPVPLYLRLP